MLAPAHKAGTVDVIIHTSWGKSAAVAADRFTYYAPSITHISPSVGPTVGGQSVTLTGTGLDSSMTVMFGSTPGSSVSCAGSSTSCTVSSAPGTRSVYITAKLAGSTSVATSADLYTYAIFPSVASVSPWQAPVTGGIAVTITGTNFSTVSGATTIQFGTLAATAVTCSSTTMCTATAPVRDASAAYLKVSVTATVNGHKSLQYVPFEFGTPPPPPPCKGTTCN